MNKDASTSSAMQSLTPKQRAFVIAYAEKRSGIAAARAAGYKGSDQTLRSIAHENLTKPHIKKALKDLEAPALEKAQVNVTRLVERLSYLAFSPLSNDIKISGQVKSIEILLKMAGALKDEGTLDRPTHLDWHFIYRQGQSPEEVRRNLLDYLRRH